jgi:hypothetical protein
MFLAVWRIRVKPSHEKRVRASVARLTCPDAFAEVGSIGRRFVFARRLRWLDRDERRHLCRGAPGFAVISGGIPSLRRNGIVPQERTRIRRNFRCLTHALDARAPVTCAPAERWRRNRPVAMRGRASTTILAAMESKPPARTPFGRRHSLSKLARFRSA